MRSASNSAWAWSTCRSRSPTSSAKIRKSPPIPGSAGSARCRTSRAPSRCNRWWANSPHATGRDQKDMLLELIGSPRIVNLSSVKDLWNYGEPYDSYPIDTARLRKVVEVVADKGNWGRTVPKGHGLGIAAHRSFVSYIATIVEVSVGDKGKLTVHQVDTAIDCGTYRQPGTDPVADRGRRDHGAQSRQIWRDHLQGRQGAAGQFRRFPGDPDGRSPARDQRPHRAASMPIRRPAASASRACRRSRRR